MRSRPNPAGILSRQWGWSRGDGVGRNKRNPDSEHLLLVLKTVVILPNGVARSRENYAEAKTPRMGIKLQASYIPIDA